MAQGLEEKREGECTDAFLQRMEAQCNEIRRYRQDVLRSEGRQLSQDQAALEWIERYAEVFDRNHGDT